MAELIDKQDAITALSHMCSEDEKGITVSRANVDSMLKSLLPAQPEERTMEEFMYGQDMGNPEDGSL